MDSLSFNDIAPYAPDLYPEKLAALIKEPGFEHAIKWVMPDVDYEQFSRQIASVTNPEDFQRVIMYPFLEWLERNTTDGVSVSGLENYADDKSYTIITNHRDIVLDASFLNLNFLNASKKTTEIAIGDNLLIYPWIEDLVRLNKSVIVRRGLKMTKALEAARNLSAYIHYAINEKHESVWIAQREGRAKDSNDLTQESLIKMLGLSGDGTMEQNIIDINLLPTSISYEYDPNDYLKIKEFLLKRRDPEYTKSQHDDLLSMETGLLTYKGRVHFTLTPCISPELQKLPLDGDRSAFLHNACRLIDRAIHAGYKLFPINYIAFDTINSTNRFERFYDEVDIARVNEYTATQLAKVDLDDITSDEREFMHTKFLEMYANPLVNKLRSIEPE